MRAVTREGSWQSQWGPKGTTMLPIPMGLCWGLGLGVVLPPIYPGTQSSVKTPTTPRHPQTAELLLKEVEGTGEVYE